MIISCLDMIVSCHEMIVSCLDTTVFYWKSESPKALFLFFHVLLIGSCQSARTCFLIQ